ncbi:MAG: glutamate-5-semialdehyde dehydrogenase [Sphaerochaetaceae bacterium]
MNEQLNQLKWHQRALRMASLEERNAMLLAIATALENNSDAIQAANEQDLLEAKKTKLAQPLQKRLSLDADKLASVAVGVRQVAALADPIGTVRQRRLLDEGLVLEKVDVPIGVIGMIFESRPDALIQILSLCLKSGNAIVLKGGSEALRTNAELVATVRKALEPFGPQSGWIVHLQSREDVKELLSLDHIVDLLIPRGSNEFVRYIMENTHIPVLGHADGLCAMYIDKEADVSMAVKVAVDAKTQYPAVCNAIETLLVHSEVASEFLPLFKKELDRFNVVVHGDQRVASLIPCVAATTKDWQTEYLDYEIAIKVVDSAQQAIDHISQYGSGHTDAIITQNKETARQFLQEVDSADVFWNCSTRFADGFRYGLGAEVGISTQKIHARGPVGLEGLVVAKWLLCGHGDIVDSYEKGEKTYLHRDMPNDGISAMGNKTS